MSVAHELRVAARGLRKSPAFTTVAVLTLALGIGATTAIFSVVNAVLFQPLPYENADELETVWGQYLALDLEQNYISIPEVEDMRAQTQALSGIGVYFDLGGANLSDGDRPERVTSALVSHDLFDVVGVAPALGREFRQEEEVPGNALVVVLSHSFWQRYFAGDPKVIGRTVTLDNQPHQVIGVMPRGFRWPYDESIDVWAPLAFEEVPVRGNHSYMVVARRAPGVTHAQANADIGLIASRMQAEYPAAYSLDSGFGMYVVPLREHLLGDARAALLLLFGAVGFLMLIVCANVANLHLARNAARRRDMAVRAALGARRRRLIAQLLIESLLLSLVGAAIGFVIALWTVDVLAALSPVAGLHPDGLPIDGRVLAFVVGVALLTGLVFGIAPALDASGGDIAGHLKDSGTRVGGSAAGKRLRQSLVVAQVALALVLLAGAGVMVRSLAQVRAIDPGFDAGEVYTMTVDLPYATYADDASRVGFFSALQQRVAALPGVRAVGLLSHRPMSGKGWSGGYQLLDYAGPIVAMGKQGGGEAARRSVSAGYFETLEVPLLAGRDFELRDDATSAPVIVVDELFVRRFWPDGRPADALGRRVAVNGTEREIVGVVGHVHDDSLESSTREQMYFPYPQMGNRMMRVLVRADADFGAVLSGTRRAVASIDPSVAVFQAQALGERIDESLSGRSFSTLLLAVFAIVALALAAIGIYGVIAYSVTQRTHEIGVRVALGAQPRHVIGLIVRQALAMTAIGIAVGVLGSLVFARALEGDTFGVSATDPLTVLVVAGALALVAVVAAFVPGQRAAHIDPGEALRYE